MARPRFDRLEAEKREAILQAAAREMVAFGYEGASLNRVILAAGLSKGAFYYYFDDKADLAATLLVWAMRDVFALIERFPFRFDDPAGYWAALRRMLDEGAASLVRERMANELATRLGLAMANDKELAARLLATPQVARLTEAALDLYRRGQRLGALRDDLKPELLLALMQAAKEAVMRTCFPRDRAATAEEMKAITDLLFDLYRRIAAPEEIAHALRDPTPRPGDARRPARRPAGPRRPAASARRRPRLPVR